jgi:hypothetical protein
MIKFISRDTRVEIWYAHCFEFYSDPLLHAAFDRLAEVTVYIDPNDGECEIRFTIDHKPFTVSFFTTDPYSDNPKTSEIDWNCADTNQIQAEIDTHPITLGELAPMFRALGQEAWIRC